MACANARSGSLGSSWSRRSVPKKLVWRAGAGMAAFRPEIKAYFTISGRQKLHYFEFYAAYSMR
jgi:hypothetical protein